MLPFSVIILCIASTEEQKKDIKKNMKKYQAQFELKDRMSQSKASKEMIEKRRKMKTDFDTWKAGAKAEYEANKVRRTLIYQTFGLGCSVTPVITLFHPKIHALLCMV